jgi:hypothetical protein
LAEFGPDFLDAEAMKSTSIYWGGGRGQSCFYWEKNSTLDSARKDLNRWFKVGMVKCQIW